MLIRNVIPFAGILISSFILVIKLRQVRGDRWSKREASFTRSVVALNVLFFVTQFPSIIAWTYLNVQYFKNSDQLSYEVTMAYFVFTLSLFLNSFTYVFPTLINFGFNRIFRDEVLIMLRFKKATRWLKKIKMKKKNCSVGEKPVWLGQPQPFLALPKSVPAKFWPSIRLFSNTKKLWLKFVFSVGLLWKNSFFDKRKF